MASGITIPIDGSTRGLEDALRDAQGEINGFSRRISGTLKGIAAGFIAGFAGREIAGFLGDSITSASDLEEAGSKAAQIFGDAMAAELQSFASSADTGLGLSQQQALDAASTFGVLGKSAGLTGGDLLGFSEDFVQLAADMASFNNTSPEEAIQAIGAGLRGESEPLRRFGVLLDQAALEARALEEGIWDGEGALTSQEKAMAAAAEIMAQTTDQQGDFARTSDGLASQTKILQAQFANLQAEIGQKLLPVAVAFATWLNNEGLPALQRFGGWLQDNIPPILQAVGAWWERHRDTIVRTLEIIWVTVQEIWNQIKPFIVTAMEGIAAFLRIIGGIIRGDWDAVWDGIKAFFSSWWEQIKNLVSNQVGLVKDLLGLGWDAIKLITGLAWDAVKKLVKEAWGELKDAVSTGIEEVVAFMIELPGLILSALGDLGTLLYDAGADVMRGLIEGIKSKIGEVKDLITGLAGDIASSFASALGIGSPSRVFIELGEDVLAGLDIGLRNGGPNVTGRMTNLAAALRTPFAYDEAAALRRQTIHTTVMVPDGRVLGETVVEHWNHSGGAPLLLRGR